jgi:hypothetical protein
MAKLLDGEDQRKMKKWKRVCKILHNLLKELPQVRDIRGSSIKGLDDEAWYVELDHSVIAKIMQNANFGNLHKEYRNGKPMGKLGDNSNFTKIAEECKDGRPMGETVQNINFDNLHKEYADTIPSRKLCKTVILPICTKSMWTVSRQGNCQK